MFYHLKGSPWASKSYKDRSIGKVYPYFPDISIYLFQGGVLGLEKVEVE